MIVIDIWKIKQKSGELIFQLDTARSKKLWEGTIIKSFTSRFLKRSSGLERVLIVKPTTYRKYRRGQNENLLLSSGGKLNKLLETIACQFCFGIIDR